MFSISQFFSNEWCPNLLVNMIALHTALHFKYIHTFLTFPHFWSCLRLHVSCSSNKRSHPSINLGVRLLKTSRTVGESANSPNIMPAKFSCYTVRFTVASWIVTAWWFHDSIFCSWKVLSLSILSNTEANSCKPILLLWSMSASEYLQRFVQPRNRAGIFETQNISGHIVYLTVHDVAQS